MSSEQSLKNKVAVVTGAGRGIGKSIAMAFAEAGADLAICARSADEIENTQAEIEGLGRRCVGATLDISDPAQTKKFCDNLLGVFGAVDIIANNAGAYLERGEFAESDPDLWWKTIEVNLRGPYLITRHLISDMNEGGKIINLTSGKGFSAGANSTAYHASKAALNMLTEGLANELWSRKIDVNSLIPGPTATTTFDNNPVGKKLSPEEILKKDLPPGLPAWERVKHPDEVGAFALWLASQPIGGATGQVFSLARRPL